MGSNVINPHNWHWVDKNCLPWAKTYFETKLSTIVVDNDGCNVKVTKVGPITGDCDITQRKGKVRCLFDMCVTLEAEFSNGTVQSLYTIVLPEFEHDQDEDDYNFEIRGGDLDYRPVIRKQFIPLALEVFQQFQADLLSEHEESLVHNVD